jgi:hypothetical protein
MRRAELEKYVGKIICFDMVNRERPLARLIELTDDYAIIKDPVIYVPVPTNSGMQVQAISYAGPLFEVKNLHVGYEHIVAILDAPAQMEQAYIRHTSGLMTEAKPKIIVP